MMQHSKSYLWLVAVAGALGAAGLSACVVTTGTDVGGFGGDFGSFAGAATMGGGGAAAAGGPSAGAPSAGAPAGGAATAGGGAGGAAAGSAGAPDTSKAPACDSGLTPAGTPLTACVPDVADDCTKCIKTNCCMQYEGCFATNPGNVCGYGGPNGKGEFACYRSCLQGISMMSGGVIAPSDQEMCANNCGTTLDLKGPIECGDSSIGLAANDLILCVAEHACNSACYGG